MSAGGFDVITIGHTNTTTGQREHEVQMPRFGLGVWQMSEGGECKTAVQHALSSGYRLIDTARSYANEPETGQAIRESGVPRDDLFVVTKLRRPHATSYEAALEHCRSNLDMLGLDSIDL